MPLYALEDLDDALDVTRSFLTPVDRTAWAKLAIVVLFVGGPGGTGLQYVAGGGGNGGGQAPPGGVFPPDIPPRAWALIAVGVGLAVLVGLALLLVGAVMEFVLVESLRTGEVAVRRYWSRRWRQGIRLFGFRLVVGALLLVGVVVLAAPLLLPALGAGPVGIAALVGVGVLFGLAVVAVAALVQVPVTTYLRYYALLVLGDVAPRFDLIPDRRAAVRDADSTA